MPSDQDDTVSPPFADGAAGGNGRAVDGKFAKGNPGGPGNPHGGEQARARAKFYASIRDRDVVMALRTIRRTMRQGKPAEQLAAARELLDRVIGRAVAADLLARIEALEQRAQEANRR